MVKMSIDDERIGFIDFYSKHVYSGADFTRNGDGFEDTAVNNAWTEYLGKWMDREMLRSSPGPFPWYKGQTKQAATVDLDKELTKFKNQLIVNVLEAARHVLKLNADPETGSDFRDANGWSISSTNAWIRLESAMRQLHPDLERPVLGIGSHEVMGNIPYHNANAVPLTFTYTNYRGETDERTVLPVGIYQGSNQYHPDEQWLLEAWDISKGAYRNFAINDILSFKKGRA